MGGEERRGGWRAGTGRGEERWVEDWSWERGGGLGRNDAGRGEQGWVEGRWCRWKRSEWPKWQKWKPVEFSYTL